MNDKVESETRDRIAAQLGRVMAELRVALAFLTLAPVPAAPEAAADAPPDAPPDAPTLAEAMRVFPMIGAAIGLAGALVYGLAAGLGLPGLPGALLAVAAMVLLTGALHEDGLGDTADGLAGDTPETRLAIMRDSRIGTYGMLALVLVLGLRAAAVADMAVGAGAMAAAGALIAAAAWSRAVMVGMAHYLPLAGDSGMAASAGQPSGRAAAQAAALGILLALLFVDLRPAVMLLLVGAIAGGIVAMLVRQRLGGYNGDGLGAAQQLAETGALLAVAAVL